MKQPETPREWLMHFDNLRAKADNDYQQTGSQRYYNAQVKYENICDAFRALIDIKGEREVDIKKRMSNRDYTIERLVNPTYSKDEVIELLKKAVWW